jgi:hypothetical protein
MKPRVRPADRGAVAIGTFSTLGVTACSDACVFRAIIEAPVASGINAQKARSSFNPFKVCLEGSQQGIQKVSNLARETLRMKTRTWRLILH